MSAARRVAVAVATTALVLAVLIGAWELYRWIWISAGWTWPFVVDDTSMPHVHTIVRALFEQPTAGVGDILIVQLFHASLFTAKEAAVGFLLGASIGFALGVFMSQWRILQRGLLPYVVASQTVPILAVAPIVVVYLGSLHVAAWFSVSVIAAYLTFFPVAINTLRGLLSTDRRAVELMRAFAAGRWAILWKLRIPAALPYIFSALKVSATACIVGAIIGEAPSKNPTAASFAVKRAAWKSCTIRMSPTPAVGCSNSARTIVWMWGIDVSSTMNGHVQCSRIQSQR